MVPRVPNPNRHSHHDQQTQERVRPRLRRAPPYRVVLLNDDYTPMDFVIALLMETFGHDRVIAEGITLAIHHAGRGVCGVYTKEVAETKVQCVEEIARESGHPLTCILERD